MGALWATLRTETFIWGDKGHVVCSQVEEKCDLACKNLVKSGFNLMEPGQLVDLDPPATPPSGWVWAGLSLPLPAPLTWVAHWGNPLATLTMAAGGGRRVLVVAGSVPPWQLGVM